jgi:putative effector of murein hydrolase
MCIYKKILKIMFIITCSIMVHVLDIDERFKKIGLFKLLYTTLVKIILLIISKLAQKNYINWYGLIFRCIGVT